MTEFEQHYAYALYDLAQEEDIVEQIYSQLRVVCQLFYEDQQYMMILSSPTIDLAQRLALIDQALSDSVHPYVVNFIKILMEKQSVLGLSGCVEAFSKRYDDAHEIKRAIAVTAVGLDSMLIEKLKQKLETITGKTIILENQVEPGCLGGVILKFEDMQIDGSVKAKLDALRKQITATIA